MKISDVALAIYVDYVSKGNDALRNPKHYAEKSYELAEVFMDVRDDYLTRHGLDDEDRRPI